MFSRISSSDKEMRSAPELPLSPPHQDETSAKAKKAFGETPHPLTIDYLTTLGKAEVLGECGDEIGGRGKQFY